MPRDLILTDFLRSNAAVPQLRERIVDSIRTRAGETPEVITFAEARLTDEVLGVLRGIPRDRAAGHRRRIRRAARFLTAAGVTGDDVKRVRAALLG